MDKREYWKTYRKTDKNKEYQKEYQKEYRKANKNKNKEYQKEYYKTHKKKTKTLFICMLCSQDTEKVNIYKNKFVCDKCFTKYGGTQNANI